MGRKPNRKLREPQPAPPPTLTPATVQPTVKRRRRDPRKWVKPDESAEE